MVTPQASDAVMTLALDALAAVPDLPPDEAQRVTDSIVCWGEETPALQQMTPAQWARVVTERKRIGRPLDRAEVVRLIESDGGDHDDA